jgi:hypothetical protein
MVDRKQIAETGLGIRREGLRPDHGRECQRCLPRLQAREQSYEGSVSGCYGRERQDCQYRVYHGVELTSANEYV